MKRLRLALGSGIAAIAALAIAAGPPAEAAVPSFTFTPMSVSSVTSVSPDVYFRASTGTYYLFTTGMAIGVYTSTDGETWSRVVEARTPAGPYSDASVIDMPDGTFRMYLTERQAGSTLPCSGKQLRYATSTDLMDWTLQPGTLLADLGCGVPDVVRDGSDFLLYYVRGGDGLDHGIYRATSADGLTWTAEPGIIAPKDMVDPSVVKVADGEWLMMTADFPSGKTTAPFFQKLYVATSGDGRSWDFGDRSPVYAPESVGVFDPNLVLVPGGQLKAWFARGASAEAATVAYGVLTATDPPALLKPGKPAAAFTGARAVTFSWDYPAAGAAPDGFVVQRRKGSTWVAIADVAGSSRSWGTTRKALGVASGQRITVRVVAVLGVHRAASPQVRVRVP